MKKEVTSRTARIFWSLAAAVLMVAPGLALEFVNPDPTSSPVPPKNLKLIDGHWTPWNPPAPAEGAEVYVIEKGDNLWNLATRDLEDPYLWPRIWDLNRYILDSHWIYPGDPILMPGPVTVVAEEELPPVVEGDGTGDLDPGFDFPVEAAMSPPVDPSGRPRNGMWQKPRPNDVADWSEMLCSGYIVAEPEDSESYIYAAEEEQQTLLGTGDIVYINQGLSSGVRPGDKFFIVHKEEKVMHPVYNRRLGWLFRKKAILQVMTAQADSATAEIIDGCDSVHVGYDIIRYSELKSPQKRDTGLERYGVEDNGNVNGHVVYGGLAQNAVGQGDIVLIDLGMADGVEVGDYLMIYRENVTGQKYNEAGFLNWEWKHKSTVHALNVRRIPKGKEIPRAMLGELAIIDANHHTATAKVMYSWREIYMGDQIQLLD